MSAREDILSTLRTRRVRNSMRAPPYHPPAPSSDLVAQFCACAIKENAEVRVIDSMEDVPSAVAEILRARNLPAIVHLPDAALENLAKGLTIERKPPGPDDAALALAPFGIAETGTLAYPASNERPASWHFRAGLEIAVLRTDAILPHFENVIARVKAAGLPHTLNLVTGPSRTGDIEQTLELGAHGPKALVILIIKD
jgi:L-lactate dehydrogenase complex protein LldG